MSISILITIFIVIFTLLLNGRKKVKTPTDATPPPAPKMQDVEPISPKNEDYFTYETLEPETDGSPVSPPPPSNPSFENYQQTTENEQQNAIDLKCDEEEIKKGIIYSIILKKPEF